jgi:hypothetical protein
MELLERLLDRTINLMSSFSRCSRCSRCRGRPAHGIEHLRRVAIRLLCDNQHYHK